MSASIDDIFKPEELRAARTMVYADEIRQLKLTSKRAPTPAERIALAELEQRMRAVHAELLTAGMVDPLPEGLAA